MGIVNKEAEIDELLHEAILKIILKVPELTIYNKCVNIVIGSSLGRIEEQLIEYAALSKVTTKFYDCGAKIKKRFCMVRDIYFVSNTCVTGVDALLLAQALIEHDKCPCLILTADVNGKFIKQGLKVMHLLSTDKTMRPFAKNRNGMVLRTQSIALLVDKESVSVKNTSYGRIVYAINGISNIDEFSIDIGLLNTLEAVKKRLSKKVDLVISAANGTHSNDIIQANTIREAFGSSVPVSSFKHVDNHTLSSSVLNDITKILRIWNENYEIKSIDYELDNININIIKTFDWLKGSCETVICIGVGLPKMHGVIVLCK